MTEILIGFAINFLSQVLKKYVAPKWGEDGVQFTVFLLACVASGIYVAYKHIPSFANFSSGIMIFFSLSIASYETIWKKLSTVKSTAQLK